MDAFRISAMPLLSLSLRCSRILLVFSLSHLLLAQQIVPNPSGTAARAPIPQTIAPAVNGSVASFKDIAEKAGINFEIVSGEKNVKKYIIETTGPGVAIVDYDNDGWPDLFFVNGTKLGNQAKVAESTNHLYRNNHNGTFTDATDKAGLRASGWGQGVCVGDYDNDGFDDLYVTYYGKNRLYHNLGNGKFEEVAVTAGVAGGGTRWGTGCAF